MRKLVSRSLFVAACLALAPIAGADSTKLAAIDKGSPAKEAVTADTVVQRHIAAIGGEKVLRAGKTFSFTVTGEKMGKKFSKTVHQARPNLLRVDIQSDDGAVSKGFDGKVAWVKKGAAPAEMLTPEETTAMKGHAEFDEPLLDYARRGTTVKLLGTSEVASRPAYELEVAFANGDVERQFLDASSYLLVKRIASYKDKDGKLKQSAVQFGDYKSIGGRMVNHSVSWQADDGKTYTSTVSNVSHDKPIAAKLFAMPK
jgi:hypothetical protein